MSKILKNAPGIMNPPNSLVGIDPQVTLENERRKTLERQQKHDAALKLSFSEWLGDISYIDDYAMYELLGRDVLIRIFRYRAEDAGSSSKIFHSWVDDRSAGAVAFDKNVPIARVISVGPQVSMFKSGDIVTIMDAMGSISENPAHGQWMEAANSKPATKTSEPPRYVDNLIQWAKYMFVANKLTSAGPEDYQTFLLPDTYIRTKIKADEN